LKYAKKATVLLTMTKRYLAYLEREIRTFFNYDVGCGIDEKRSGSSLFSEIILKRNIVWHWGQFTQCCFKHIYLWNGFNVLVFIKTWHDTANLLLENGRPTSHLKILPSGCCRV